jgi:hypothetical protein
MVLEVDGHRADEGQSGKPASTGANVPIRDESPSRSECLFTLDLGVGDGQVSPEQAKGGE